jgi:hypothetical protein
MIARPSAMTIATKQGRGFIQITELAAEGRGGGITGLADKNRHVQCIDDLGTLRPQVTEPALLGFLR